MRTCKITETNATATRIDNIGTSIRFGRPGSAGGRGDPSSPGPCLIFGTSLPSSAFTRCRNVGITLAWWLSSARSVEQTLHSPGRRPFCIIAPAHKRVGCNVANVGQLTKSVGRDWSLLPARRPLVIPLNHRPSLLRHGKRRIDATQYTGGQNAPSIPSRATTRRAELPTNPASYRVIPLPPYPQAPPQCGRLSSLPFPSRPRPCRLRPCTAEPGRQYGPPGPLWLRWGSSERIVWPNPP